MSWQFPTSFSRGTDIPPHDDTFSIIFDRTAPVFPQSRPDRHYRYHQLKLSRAASHRRQIRVHHHFCVVFVSDWSHIHVLNILHMNFQLLFTVRREEGRSSRGSDDGRTSHMNPLNFTKSRSLNFPASRWGQPLPVCAFSYRIPPIHSMRTVRSADRDALPR
jgi:hypothetical protein